MTIATIYDLFYLQKLFIFDKLFNIFNNASHNSISFPVEKENCNDVAFLDVQAQREKK